MTFRLAVVTSHPIQYQAPYFRALARAVELDVFFCHRQDAAGQAAAGFGERFEWDVPLLDGYRHHWLENRASQPGVDRYAGCDTPEVGAALDATGPDACLVMGWYLKSYLQTIRACRRAGRPVLVRGDSHLRTARSAVRRAAKYFPYRWLLRNIDAHLYVGDANRTYLRHYGVDDDRLFFAPHFVDNDRFAGAAHEARVSGAAKALRTRHGIPENAFLFLFAGKLIDVKRTRDFIDALARVAPDRPTIRGAIVGAGPLQTDLERLRDDRRAPVSFLGFHNQSAMPTCYAAADALVLPSAHESWGLVVNEAMACGLPAVVSDTVGAAPDLVTGTGRVFPSGNVTRLAGAMVDLHDQLRRAPDGVRDAVLRRISDCTCDGAVMGTLEALAAVTRPTHAHVQHV